MQTVIGLHFGSTSSAVTVTKTALQWLPIHPLDKLLCLLVVGVYLPAGLTCLTEHTLKEKDPVKFTPPQESAVIVKPCYIS